MNKKFKYLMGLSFIFLTGVVLSSCSKDNATSDVPAASQTTTQETTKKYKVTFDSDGGTKIDDQEIEENKKANKPTNPIKENCDFLGWYNGDSEYSFETPVTKDLNLKAIWQKYTYVSQNYGFTTGIPTSLKFTFKDSYVSEESNKFNKDLAMFSLGCSLATSTEEVATKYYTDLGFDNVSYQGTGEGYEGICYCFSHKTIGDTDLIIASVRGVGYTTEWEGNIDIGTTGNHKNFDECANKIIDKLEAYITTNKKKSTLKLLFDGYSRGAGIANVMSQKVLSKTTKLTEDKNFYCYSFATIKGLAEANKGNYDNVFNIVSSADLLTYLAPKEYGFVRCGIDIDIYDTDIDNILTNYNQLFILPKFSPMSGCFEKETDIPQYIINTLLRPVSSDPTDPSMVYNMVTREEFVNNYKNTFGFVFNKILFGLKAETKTKIIDELKKMIKESMFSVLSLISSGQALYDFINPFIAEDGIEYSTTELLNVCNTVVGFISNLGNKLLVLALDPYKDVMVRTIMMHTSVIYFVMLNHYTVQA